jgi:multiple sugar transport system ATP-binding protein
MQLASGDDGVATAVVVVEPTGADTQVFTKIAGVEVTSVFRERHAFRPGEIIRLRPDPARAHLFDAGTGMRLVS